MNGTDFEEMVPRIHAMARSSRVGIFGLCFSHAEGIGDFGEKRIIANTNDPEFV